MLPTLSLEPTSVNPLSVLNWHPFYPLLRPASFHYLFGPAHRRPLFGLVSFHPLYGRHPPLVWAKILSSFCLDRHTSVLSLDWYPSILFGPAHFRPLFGLVSSYPLFEPAHFNPLFGLVSFHPLFELVSFNPYVRSSFHSSFVRTGILPLFRWTGILPLFLKGILFYR